MPVNVELLSVNHNVGWLGKLKVVKLDKHLAAKMESLMVALMAALKATYWAAELAVH